MFLKLQNNNNNNNNHFRKVIFEQQCQISRRFSKQFLKTLDKSAFKTQYFRNCELQNCLIQASHSCMFATGKIFLHFIANYLFYTYVYQLLNLKGIH